MSAKMVPNIADLKSMAKELNHAKPVEKESSKAESNAVEDTLESLQQLYQKHNGDLDEIFAHLGSSPEKAKKPHNKPKSAEDFAQRYLEGFYTLTSEADKKSRKWFGAYVNTS